MASNVFALFIEPLLAAFASDEASKYVAAERAAGRRLEDALLDAIEALPQRKTVRLRGWVRQYHDYLTWLDMEKRGWIMSGRHFNERVDKRIFVNVPKNLGDSYAKWEQVGIDAEAPVAAAVAARTVKMVGQGPLTGFSYKVTRAW